MSFAGHNPYLVSALAAHRKKKQEAREAKANLVRDFGKRVEDLKTDLRNRFRAIDGVLVYINKSQVNVDFLNGDTDKVYLCCSRKHNKVRVDFLIRGFAAPNNKLPALWFKKHYGLEAKDATGRRKKDTILRFMVEAEKVGDLIETIEFDFRPMIHDTRPHVGTS